MGSQDTHHGAAIDYQYEIHRWLESVRSVINQMPVEAFVNGTLHDVNRAKAATASLNSKMEEIYFERSRRRQLADR